MQEDKNIFVTQFYIPDEEKRLDELRYCVSRNINNPLINLVILVVEEGTDSDLIPVGEKIKIEWVSKRPTYCDLFNISLKNSTDSNGLLIISNSAIFLEEDDIIKTKERNFLIWNLELLVGINLRTMAVYF